MRRLCGLRWKEWWLVSVVGKGKRKVTEERGSAALSLYEVFGWLLVMEMEVFKLVVTMLASERRGGERERQVLLVAGTGLGRLVFLLSLDPNFSLV
ncbi:hypothetical protein D5086_027118 [Populus alba]|uniref:Uncharacterized protein n=1 Tax=Populus alba TaxID=43335 RepID=A0ACC4B4C3_POPAL